jgi:hypothetical protein
VGLGNLLALSPELFYEQRTFDVSFNDSTNNIGMGNRFHRGLTEISNPLDRDIQTNMTCVYHTYSLFELL